MSLPLRFRTIFLNRQNPKRFLVGVGCDNVTSTQASFFFFLFAYFAVESKDFIASDTPSSQFLPSG